MLDAVKHPYTLTKFLTDTPVKIGSSFLKSQTDLVRYRVC